MSAGRALLALGAAAITVVIGFAILRPQSAPASEGGPGMSLSGPGVVSTGQTFTILVSASPPPGAGVAGFATEVVLPPGLTWIQRPSCEDENQTTVGGRGTVATCVRGGDAFVARHAVATAVQPPPLPAFDAPLDALIELDARCVAPGVHPVVLTAVPASSFGAIYFGINAQQIGVKTDAVGLADKIEVACTGEQPTPTPCPPEGCAKTPTMRLAGPSDVPTGEVFALRVDADPPPNVPVSGFQTEVHFPPGLTWVQRPTCEDENLTTVNGGNPGFCGRVSFANRARHFVGSNGPPVPVPALDTPLNTLLQIDVRCLTPGSHALALTAFPAYYHGAAYTDTNLQYYIGVTTKWPGIADTLTVTCTGDAPSPTATTPPPLSTATPTATPCPPDGCPTYTPTPTSPSPPTTTPCSPHGCPLPGMTLSGPSSVALNGTFETVVSASPQPSFSVGGFSTEIVLPDGLTWIERASCHGENLTSVGGAPPAACTRAGGPDGEVRHVVISSLQPPPLPPLDAVVGPILAIDVRCNTPGEHQLALTAAPSFPFGAAYFDTDTNFIPVGAFAVDLDGDTISEIVADTLTVNCSLHPPIPCAPQADATPCPTSPATASPTRTATPCPTDTGPLGDTCVPLTATPTPTHVATIGDPAVASPIPTATATLFSEIDPEPAVVTPRPAATDFSEVSPALVTPRTPASNVESPDAGTGPGGMSTTPRAALGLLAIALFTTMGVALRRLGADG